MDLGKVIIDNFLTIGHAELELAGRGLLLVQGENADDTSANSNGSGKSSLVDAIFWCNYGETARGATGDAVVNRTAKKECMVQNTWIDGDMEYRIVRYRKHSTGKNSVTVSERDLKTGLGTDLTKGTDKETQEVINRILGCSVEVFRGAVYAGQEAMPDLPGMTDKSLKLLIEEAAGVEILAEAYAEANKRAVAAEKDYTAAATHAKSLQGTLTTMEAQLDDARAQHKTFEDGRKDRARAELGAVKPYQDAIEHERVKLAAFDVPAIEKELAAVQTKLEAHSARELELAEYQQAERRAELALATQTNSVTAGKAALLRAENALAAVDSKVGTPCGECGKEYCAHDLEKARELRALDVENAKKALAAIAVTARAAIAAHKDAKEAAESYAKTMPDVSALVAAATKLRTDLQSVTRIQGDIAGWERGIEQVKAKAKERLTEANPWAKAVESKEAAVTRMKADIVTALADAQVLEEKAQLYADAAKVFGPAGVRAHILDTVTPILNEKTSEYLGALADGNITATWSTLSKTAKGELREKFNIDVTHAKGGESFKLLSGGEKRKTRLGTNLALQDMVGSRAEKPIRLWIGDEIDEALDAAGLERLMGVLENKAREKGTVIVISHHALRDWIDQVITVTKKGGLSEVAGATHAGL